MELEEIKKLRLELCNQFTCYEEVEKVLTVKIDTALGNMSIIAKESERVAGVALNAERILDDLDSEFEQCTCLNAVDQKILWIAVALQCARQYILANDKFRLTSAEGDNLVSSVVPKKWHDVLLGSVPYDAIKKADPSVDSQLGGATHRFRTLGHDPVLGWIFGPMNILSDSLTKTDFTSYAVRNMRIAGMMPTSDVFDIGVKQSRVDKFNLPCAVLRQALHFGSDYFTKQGLPIPFIPSIDNDFTKFLVTQCNIDMYSITRGATVSSLINSIILIIHQLFNDRSSIESYSTHKAKTHKIILYSNLIATTSNVIWVAMNIWRGNKASLKQIDVGGFLVTLYRIVSDIHFIGNLKREFITERFNEMIRGEEYNF